MLKVILVLLKSFQVILIIIHINCLLINSLLTLNFYTFNSGGISPIQIALN